ncbi:hypothetical protein, partial [Streptococcus anginosus]|uniref:hypothetical protein n=1 Tax=Streptococcus anginosus TaxID=1328 RepID=UPI002ED7DA50
KLVRKDIHIVGLAQKINGTRIEAKARFSSRHANRGDPTSKGATKIQQKYHNKIYNYKIYFYLLIKLIR